ncbi:SprT-like domain-containing protein [Actinomycetaceae bacterium MB13-C1-2]|nr:SprT-like domain-containing protein [Actinomycetaceae bacterium MB13-C1-2]
MGGSSTEEAVGYVNSFALDVLIMHDLQGWAIVWDHAKRRAGACNYAKKTLSFSKTLMALYPRDVQRDVVLHEAAHALAGPKAGHGPEWKKIATEIGASPKALLPNWLPPAPAKWIGTCPRCGQRRNLHRMPKRVVSCGRCSKRFDPSVIFEWTRDGIPTQPGGDYARELKRISRRRTLLG